MAEWLNAAVLKTVRGRKAPLEFESLLLRSSSPQYFRVGASKQLRSTAVSVLEELVGITSLYL